MIRVLLVEDTRLAARRLATELAREDGIAIVGRLDFDDGVERLAAHFRPTVILFNTDYMVSQVLPVASELRVTIPGCAIVIVSDPDKRGMLPPRRRSPELSFVVKGTPVPVLAEAGFPCGFTAGSQASGAPPSSKCHQGRERLSRSAAVPAGVAAAGFPAVRTRLAGQQ